MSLDPLIRPLGCLLLFACVVVSSLALANEKQIKPGDDTYGTVEDTDGIWVDKPELIVELRGYEAETHYAHTHDGYHINLVRIVNPLLKADRLKRPVLFNHGFLESATIWLANSKNVTPSAPPDGVCTDLTFDEKYMGQRHFVNGPMVLANHGYDVWLLSMRGTDFSLQHDTKDYTDHDFWDFSLDDFALADIPAAIDYIRDLTRANKVGYVGHSQATYSIFALLADKPEFADVVEPVIAVAPVIYVNHITSITKPLWLSTLAAPKKQGPWPTYAKKLREASGSTCSKNANKPTLRPICKVLNDMIAGKGYQYLVGHYLPYYSSLKVMRQFGQNIKKDRWMKYDYGLEGNIEHYHRDDPPDYDPAKIRSESICLFWARTDAITVEVDVERFKDGLNVTLLHETHVIEPFNHFDLIVDVKASKYVYGPILRILEKLEHSTGICSNATSEPKRKYRDSKSTGA